MQPRMSSGGGGKSNDDIVYEMAEGILGKIMDKLDIEEANSEMFETDEKGRLNSLTTVLTQETDRYNKLLKVIKVLCEQDLRLWHEYILLIFIWLSKLKTSVI